MNANIVSHGGIETDRYRVARNVSANAWSAGPRPAAIALPVGLQGVTQCSELSDQPSRRHRCTIYSSKAITWYQYISSVYFKQLIIYYCCTASNFVHVLWYFFMYEKYCFLYTARAIAYFWFCVLFLYPQLLYTVAWCKIVSNLS